MPLDFPPYYAGVAGEDMLDEFLVGKRELDHGQSATVDVRRFLNVKYHQASIGKLKKAALACTIAILLIIVVMFTVGSPSTRHLPVKTLPEPTAAGKTGTTEIKQRPSFVLATNPDKPFELTLNCNSCALVSSSGMLLGNNAGSQIDSADCVFRLNSAPTIGFEEDVGSKTTVRVFSVSGLKSLIRDTWQKSVDTFQGLDYMILLGPNELLCRNCTLSKLYQKLAHYLENTELLQVTKEAYQKAKQETKNLGLKYARALPLIFLGKDLGMSLVRTLTGLSKQLVDMSRQMVNLSLDLPISTRFYALSLARHVCPQIRVFGMELGNPCERLRSVPMFYWDPESWQSKCLTQEKRIKQRMFQGVQRLLMEREIFHSWGDKYHIEFFYPSQNKVT